MKRKSIIDYLKLQEDKRAEYVHYVYDNDLKAFIQTEFSLVLLEYGIHIYIDGDLKKIVSIHSNDIKTEIMCFLEDEYGVPVRFCHYCGGLMQDGMTDEWDIYSHEECFDKYMDEVYGKGNWRIQESGEPNEADGYYEELVDGKWKPLGIYYTEWR